MASLQKLFRRLLFKAQDYGDNEKIILQYNISAIILENVEVLRGNITKHINICYYFVTNRIQKEEISVECRSTNDKTGDLFIKPKQGSTKV